MSPSKIVVEQISAEETLSLRGKVLRPHLPPHLAVLDCQFPGDHVPLAGHFGAIESDSKNITQDIPKSIVKKIIGVATIHPENLPDLPQAKLFVQNLGDLSADASVWRLRGMATEGELRGKGFGGDVLQACIQHARKNGAKLIWANARTPALRFYERHGFKTLGEEYTMPGIGPHYLICLIL